MSRVKQLVGVGVVSLLVASCSPGVDPSKVSSPPSTTATGTTVLNATDNLTLSGFVSTDGPGVPPFSAQTPIGIPLQGVRVRIQQGDHLVEATTDQSGYYSVSGLSVGDVHLDLSKDGYFSVSSVLPLNGNIRHYARLTPGRDFPKLDIFLNATLTGVVFEETPSGRTAIPHATVYCEPCGVETHTFATTDENGFYSFTGVWTDAGHFPTRIMVSLEGYTDPEGLAKPTPPNPSGPGWREVVVAGDTRFDMQLVRR